MPAKMYFMPSSRRMPAEPDSALSCSTACPAIQARLVGVCSQTVVDSIAPLAADCLTAACAVAPGQEQQPGTMQRSACTCSS